MPEQGTVRVGLLAYGAIGHEHNLAVQATDGLELTAVADLNPERVAAAQEIAPTAKGFADAEEMLDSGVIDLVVVSTPPNTHAHWATQALKRGLHVVLEKPMALTSDECDELIELAQVNERLLVVYQNRRFDADFVTLRSVIKQGRIGEAFQFESFVGGYSRPCDYWHSDAAVSGGAIFDWGSHYIDQILNLFSEPIAQVTGINHKRQWHHATNADHAQVTITFEGGKQATFVHSDLAAARRPKYYVLGTSGAIVADWDLRAEPAVADLPAILTLHLPEAPSTRVELQNIEPYEFHRELSAYLHDGTPMQVSTAQSRDVVAVMEAAELSASSGSKPVTPKLLTR